MNYYKVDYQVVQGKELLSESTYVYADKLKLSPQQIKDRIRAFRLKNYPDEKRIEIMFSGGLPTQITEQEYESLLPDND